MIAPPKKANARQAPGAGETQEHNTPKPSAPPRVAQAACDRADFVVVIPGTRRVVWGKHPDRKAAEAAAAKLRKFGFDARVERDGP